MLRRVSQRQPHPHHLLSQRQKRSSQQSPSRTYTRFRYITLFGISYITVLLEYRFEEGGVALESTVAALLLVTSTVVLSCFVVIYTVNTVMETFSGESPTMQLMNRIQDSILNSTLVGNSTLPYTCATPTPTPTSTPEP
jgi:hypothetical protein